VAEQGIQPLLAAGNIAYVPAVEFGNVSMRHDNWRERYQRLMDRAGDALTESLRHITTPFCLMCAEERAVECHRQLIAAYLAQQGYTGEHIE
jgi:hypothetical protein